MRPRDYRRAQRERIYRRWERIATRWGIHDGETYPEGRHGWIVRTMDNPKVCSNPMCCGNPRRFGRVSRQERCADISEREQRLSS